MFWERFKGMSSSHETRKWKIFGAESYSQYSALAQDTELCVQGILGVLLYREDGQLDSDREFGMRHWNDVSSTAAARAGGATYRLPCGIEDPWA